MYIIVLHDAARLSQLDSGSDVNTPPLAVYIIAGYNSSMVRTQ